MKTAYDATTLRLIVLQTLGTLSLSLTLMILMGVVCTTGAATAQEKPALPNWVQKGSFEDGETSFLLVETEEFFLQSEASMVLMGKIRNTVDSRIDDIVGAGGCRFVNLDENFIQRKIVAEEMVIEKVITDAESEKEMRRHVGYAKLRFDEDFDELVNQQYLLNFKARRLQWTGVAGILGLCWLGAAYGYLRLDNATRHFYSRRLQTLTIISCLIPLIIAALVAVSWKLF